MSKKQPHRIEVEETWAEPLLQVKSQVDGRSVYQRLYSALGEWKESLAEARAVLQSSPFASIVATTIAKKANKRGDAVLRIDDEGQMFVEVQYKSAVSTDKKRKWVSNLESLGVLRQNALELGIDISQFGRSKTLLKAAIEKAQQKPKMRKIAVAFGPVTIINPDPPELPDPNNNIN